MKALLLAFALACAASLPARSLVLLDPGHGGSDAGVTVGSLVEKDFALDVAKRVQAILKDKGVEARLTREDDRDLSLTARVTLADQIRPAAFLSLHLNASFNAEARGPRVFVPADAASDEPLAPRLEQAAGLHAAESRALGGCLARALGAAGARPVQSLKLGIFRGLDAPAALVELEFATRSGAAEELKDPARVQALAAKVAQGLLEFLQVPEAADAPH